MPKHVYLRNRGRPSVGNQHKLGLRLIPNDCVQQGIKLHKQHLRSFSGGLRISALLDEVEDLVDDGNDKILGEFRIRLYRIELVRTSEPVGNSSSGIESSIVERAFTLAQVFEQHADGGFDLVRHSGEVHSILRFEGQTHHLSGFATFVKSSSFGPAWEGADLLTRGWRSPAFASM